MAARASQILDEIRFVPVPDANTRIEGAVSGQYDYVDALPVEAFDRLKGQKTTQPVLLKPFGWPVFVMNTKQGVMSNLDAPAGRAHGAERGGHADRRIRQQGVLRARRRACSRKDYVWHTDGRHRGRLQSSAIAEKAKALLKKASYNGKPLRILTSRQYEFHYKMAQVAAEYLKQAGFAVELMVVDWATLTQRRTDPALWDIYITHSPFLPEPALTGILSAIARPAGGRRRRARRSSTPSTPSPIRPSAPALWAEVQKAIYDEVPAIKIGDFNALSAAVAEGDGRRAGALALFLERRRRREPAGLHTGERAVRSPPRMQRGRRA